MYSWCSVPYSGGKAVGTRSYNSAKSASKTEVWCLDTAFLTCMRVAYLFNDAFSVAQTV